MKVSFLGSGHGYCSYAVIAAHAEPKSVVLIHGAVADGSGNGSPSRRFCCLTARLSPPRASRSSELAFDYSDRSQAAGIS